MLLVPWAVGAWMGGGAPGGAILLLGTLLLAFLAQNQLMEHARLGHARAPDALARRRALAGAAALEGLAGLGLLALVAGWARPALLGFAVAGLALTAASVALVRSRQDRAAAGQFLAAVALPLSAPAAYHVARPALDAAAGALWAVNAAFFVAAVLYVRVKIESLARRARPGAGRGRLAGPALAIDLVLIGLVAVALPLGGLSARTAIALVPMGLQTGAAALWPDRPVRLKRVGQLATAHALLFAALVIALA